MAHKQDIKRNEAKMLIYLDVADQSKCNITAMSLKLNITKNYLYDLAINMEYKGWIKRIKSMKSTGLTLTTKGKSKLLNATKVLQV